MKGESGWIHDNFNDAPCADATEASDYTEQEADHSDDSADDTNLDYNYDDNGKNGTEKVTSNNHKILPEQTPSKPQPMAYPPFDEAFRTLSLHTGKQFCHSPTKIITEFHNALLMDALCVQGRDMCWDLPWECTCAQDL